VHDIYKVIGIVCLLLVIGLFLRWIIGVTTWLIPLIVCFVLVVLGIFCLRKAGLIQENESVFKALGRFFEFLKQP